MDDPAAQQIRRMIRRLRDTGCITADAVADAFRAVPRHLFLPGVPIDRAYGTERAIPTHFGADGNSISSSSSPAIMAVMLEQLAVEPGQRVLEIGAGTGYNAALLAHLAGSSGAVVSIDIDAEIAAEATGHLAAAGIAGVDVVAADGWLGATGAEFDRIMATMEVWDISPHWVNQLRPGGILVAPLWLGPGLHVTVAFEKTDAGLASRSQAYCGFMPLRGPHAAPPCQTLVPHWDRRAEEGQAGHEVIAQFNQASAEGIAVLRRLLGEPSASKPSPALCRGWNLRLALEEPDPIGYREQGALWNFATGLFDASLGGLALVDGGTLWSFGHQSCLERLESGLERARPFDLAALRITAVPHGFMEGRMADAVICRPNFDFAVDGLSI